MTRWLWRLIPHEHTWKVYREALAAGWIYLHRKGDPDPNICRRCGR